MHHAPYSSVIHIWTEIADATESVIRHTKSRGAELNLLRRSTGNTVVYNYESIQDNTTYIDIF